MIEWKEKVPILNDINRIIYVIKNLSTEETEELANLMIEPIIKMVIKKVMNT